MLSNHIDVCIINVIIDIVMSVIIQINSCCVFAPLLTCRDYLHYVDSHLQRNNYKPMPMT